MALPQFLRSTISRCWNYHSLTVKLGISRLVEGGFETSTESLLSIIVHFHLLSTGIAGEPLEKASSHGMRNEMLPLKQRGFGPFFVAFMGSALIRNFGYISSKQEA
jgi:hypothetical protein